MLLGSGELGKEFTIAQRIRDHVDHRYLVFSVHGNLYHPLDPRESSQEE